MALLQDEEIYELVTEHFAGRNAIDREDAGDLVRKALRQAQQRINSGIQGLYERIGDPNA